VQGKVEHAPRLPKGVNTTPWVPKEGGRNLSIYHNSVKSKQTPERDDDHGESSKLSRRWPRHTLATMDSLHGCALVEVRSYALFIILGMILVVIV
jgi:hypothetical protein